MAVKPSFHVRPAMGSLEGRVLMARDYPAAAHDLVEAGELVRPPNDSDPAWFLGYDKDNLAVQRAMSEEELASVGFRRPQPGDHFMPDGSPIEAWADLDGDGVASDPVFSQAMPINQTSAEFGTAVKIARKTSRRPTMAVRNLQSGTITVFVDKNGNGQLDRKDQRMNAATVFVDRDGDSKRDKDEFAFTLSHLGKSTFGSVPIAIDKLKIKI